MSTRQFGVAYYPEHWPEKRWEIDAKMMREAGINLVRMGEFSWCRMEPKPDHYEFSWLDKVIAILEKEDIQVLLGTPTAGPPAWLIRMKPDVRIIYEDGFSHEFGSRSQCCVNNPLFRERSQRIASAIGKHFANNSAVIGFQIDNELGIYGTRCYCPYCVKGFQLYLSQQFKTIEALNKRWGTIFGGGEYGGWRDIPMPRKRQPLHHPSLLQASQRFVSDSYVAYLRLQADALKKETSDKLITTNTYFPGGVLDEAAMFAEVDVAGLDIYPQGMFPSDRRMPSAAFLLSMIRGVKKKRFWILEQQTGSWPGAAVFSADLMKLWAWQSVAHGAEMLLFFRWRTCRFGGEQYHMGILDHSGEANQRYQAITKMGKQIKTLSPIIDKLDWKSEVAILFSYDADLSLGLNPPAKNIDYRPHAQLYHTAAHQHGLSPDIVFNLDKLNEYQVVIAPTLRLMDTRLSEKLTTFVEQGGILVTTFLSATLDKESIAPTEGPPYLLKELLGIEVTEWSSLAGPSVIPKELLNAKPEEWKDLYQEKFFSVEAKGDIGLSGSYVGGVWCDHLTPTTATVQAVYGKGAPAPGSAAVTVHNYGKGKVFYIGTVMDTRFYGDLFTYLSTYLNKPPIKIQNPTALELVAAHVEGKALYFILNHSANRQLLQIDGKFKNIFTGAIIAGSFEVPGYEAMLLSPE